MCFRQNLLVSLSRPAAIAVLLAASLVLVSATPGCASIGPAASPTSASAPAPAPQPTISVRLSQADSGKQVALRSGESLSVRLEANPSTGYDWIVARAWDESLLELTSKDFTAVSNLPGSQGTEVWVYASKAKGLTSFTLEYKRPWEKTTAPLHTFSLTVSVTN